MSSQLLAAVEDSNQSFFKGPFPLPAWKIAFCFFIDLYAFKFKASAKAKK